MYPIETLIRYTALAVAGLGALGAGAACNAQAACAASSVGPVIWMPAMNVFRRFAGEAQPMFRFYSEVLGFEPLTAFDVGNNTQVWRIKAGTSELKLSRHEEGRKYVGGGVADATGLRLWTFFFSDEAALSNRFKNAGIPAPDFKDISQPAQYRKRALVTDPDGQSVELIITSDAPGTKYDKLEVGMVVSDLDKSLPFYRDFVGLDQLESEHDPLFDTTKHIFRHGSTLVTLRSFKKVLPADTGSAGIQYVVSSAARVDELARCHGIKIDKPLSGIPGFNVSTIWLDDPDGITNYFAETEASRASAAATP